MIKQHEDLEAITPSQGEGGGLITEVVKLGRWALLRFPPSFLREALSSAPCCH